LYASNYGHYEVLIESFWILALSAQSELCRAATAVNTDPITQLLRPPPTIEQKPPHTYRAAQIFRLFSRTVLYFGQH
jgi:hypothetical protein